MFRLLQYLGNFLALALSVLLSWVLSTAVFYFATSGGTVYSSISAVRTQCESGGKVDQTSYVAVCQGDQQAMLINVYHQSSPIVAIEVRASGNRLEISWEHSYSGWGRLSEYLGFDRRRGALPVYTLTDTSWVTPFARDITVIVPAGAIAPQIKQILTESRDATEIDMSDASRDTLADRIASDILSVTDWGAMSSNINSISLFNGRIQFVTLFMFFVASISLVAGIGLPWARTLGSNLIQLILYVGFFGTLAGMSGALEVLGSADLTNPLSKGTRLGPIGSQIALAINTTMYAVVLFGTALMLDLWLRSIVEDELEQSQTWINRRAAALVSGIRRLLEPDRNAEATGEGRATPAGQNTTTIEPMTTKENSPE